MPALHTDPLWLKRAYSDLGLQETPGSRATRRIVQLFALAGHPEVVSDEIAWCAAAMGGWLVESDLKGTGSLMARSYSDYGRKLDHSKKLPRGAIIVLKRGTGWQGHVTILLKDEGEWLLCIGGNQSNAVTEQRYRRRDLLAARWPSGVPLPGAAPAAPAPAPKPIAPKVERPKPQPKPAPDPVEPDEPDDEPEPAPKKRPWWKRWTTWGTAGVLGAGGAEGGFGLLSAAGDVVDGWPWQATVGVAGVLALTGVALTMWFTRGRRK